MPTSRRCSPRTVLTGERRPSPSPPCRRASGAARATRPTGSGGAATLTVARLPTGFGVVELDENDRVSGFDESPQLPHWVHAGVDVLDEEAIARLPEKGDHERTTFPELAAERKLYAFRHEGLW